MLKKNISVNDLAAMVQGQVVGDGQIMIAGFAPLDTAGPGTITFLAKANRLELLENIQADAVIVPKNVVGGKKPIIQVKDPYLAAAIIHNHFLATPFIAKGVHPRAHIGDHCDLGRHITVGPLVVLGNGVRLGERVLIEAGAVIGDQVSIGDDSMIKANVTIGDGCIIGRRVTIHSGTVIGSDGYGYATNERGEHIKRPQVGRVRIEDDVEIGANCCIDRATYGETWIKAGTKIDNLVQIAHNVIVGENSLIVAQVGIAGSTTLGRNVVMGGQAGAAGHLLIGDQVMIAARGAVHNDIPKGAILGGAPAIPVRQWAKCSAIFNNLPELQKKVRDTSKAISQLVEKLEKNEQEGDNQ